MAVDVAGDDYASERALLLTVDGEISFYRAIMRARPVGIHRFFHVLAIQNSIFKDTGTLLHVESIWEKLRSCYDLDALDAIDLEAEGYLAPTSSTSTPISIRSPSPSENLASHPFFREEFSLPIDESLDALIVQRRIRATASAPSSPATSPDPSAHHHHHHHPSTPSISAPTGGGRRRGRGGTRKRGRSDSVGSRGKTKLDLAGLVGGDSDSSALTQESGDEGAGGGAGVTSGTAPPGVGTPRESVVTGTDAGTDYGGEEAGEEAMEVTREASPEPSVPASPKPGRGRPKGGKRGVRGVRGTPAPSTRGVRRKRRN